MTGGAGFFINAGSAFLLTRYLTSQLGDETYGVWVLIGALAGYLGMLDFGMRGAVGRFIALHRGRADREQILSTLNTALFVLAGVGVVAAILVALFALKLHWFHRIFPVSAAELDHTRLALLIVGIQLGVVFPMCAFEGILWGHDRIDLHNIVDGAATILRAVGAAIVVGAGLGLVGLAWISLAIGLGIGISKAILCWKFAQPLVISRRYVHKSNLREISNFGFWNFLLSIGPIGRRQLTPFAISASLGTAPVAWFSFASQLIGYGQQLLIMTVNVLTPSLTKLVAERNLEKQRELMIRTGRICAAYAIYISAVVACGSHSLFSLWLRHNNAYAWLWTVAAVLVCGEWLPMSVHPYNLAVVAMAKQRPVAWRGIVELVVGLGLAVACGWAMLTYPCHLAAAALANQFPMAWRGIAESGLGLGLTAIFGWKLALIGMAIGLSIAATWFRGVFMLYYGQTILAISPWTYLRSAVVPLMIRGVPTVSVLVLMTIWRPASSWFELITYLALFSIAYWVIAAGAIPEIAAFGSERVVRKLQLLWGPKPHLAVQSESQRSQ
jgi:O-antigen/teichoic acid export membrane protein